MEAEIEGAEPEPFVPTPELMNAVLAVLTPSGLKERLKLRLAKGMTAIQVLERLPGEWRRALEEGQENPVLARRQAIYAVEHALYALGQEGRVGRQKVDLTMDLPGKGLRGVQVNVYRRLR